MTRRTLTALALVAALAGGTAVAVGPIVADAQSQQQQPAHHAAFDPGRHIEGRIAYLKTELKITDAQAPLFDTVANVMRENARAMDQVFAQRMQQYPTMNALQNMQSYERVAEAHAQHVQRLVTAFVNLYNAMPEQQKQLTDQVFRANAGANAQKRMQTGRNEVR